MFKNKVLGGTSVNVNTKRVSVTERLFRDEYEMLYIYIYIYGS